MKHAESTKRKVSVLIILLLAITPLTVATPVDAALFASVGSQIQQDDSDQEGVTFDNLLAAGSYAFYIEARNIGQQARSAEVAALVEPLRPLLDNSQDQVTRLGEFIDANADALMRSRVMMAIQPARQSLPPLLMAIELGSADAAEKFEPKIREFITLALNSGISLPMGLRVFDHTIQSRGQNSAGRGADSGIPIKRAGRVLAVSFTPFTFKGLRPQNEKSLSDDLNFRAARDRFYSETFFIYYDHALSARAAKEPAADSAERPAPAPPKMARPGTPLSLNEPEFSIEFESPALQPAHTYSADSDLPDSGPSAFEYSAEYTSAAAEHSSQAVRKKAAPPSSQTRPSPGKQRAGEQPTIIPPKPMPGDTVKETQPGGPDSIGNLLNLVMRGAPGGSSFPDALAIGLAIENDSLIVRLLMLNAQGTKMGPIPFLPVPASGPALASDVASYMPSDTDVFITASLDLYHLYDMSLAKLLPPGETSIAAFEKRLGFKIREDLLTTLGSEIAIGIPASYLSGTPFGSVTLNPQSPKTGPIFLISVRNKEALEAKLKPALELIGVKAPNEKGISEKYGDTEINTYSYGSVAFLNNYLVIGNTAAAVRHVLESRAKEQTLMASRDFHSYMQWQPRETVAQIYVSAAVLKDAFKKSQSVIDSYDAETKQFLAQFDYAPEPITYAAISDAAGPLYELRIPKNLIAKAFAELSVSDKMSRGPRNESMASTYLSMLNEYQNVYRMEHNRFGTLEEILPKDFGEKTFRGLFERLGYKLEMTLSGDKYAATATPTAYGKSGKLSFYTDSSGVIRQGDHGGRPATAADKPLGVPPNQ